MPDACAVLPPNNSRLLRAPAASPGGASSSRLRVGVHVREMTSTALTTCSPSDSRRQYADRGGLEGIHLIACTNQRRAAPDRIRASQRRLHMARHRATRGVAPAASFLRGPAQSTRRTPVVDHVQRSRPNEPREDPIGQVQVRGPGTSKRSTSDPTSDITGIRPLRATSPGLDGFPSIRRCRSALLHPLSPAVDVDQGSRQPATWTKVPPAGAGVSPGRRRGVVARARRGRRGCIARGRIASGTGSRASRARGAVVSPGEASGRKSACPRRVARGRENW